MQLPSNMILVRVGGPLWLGIMITTWGAIAATFAALSSATMFYILRLLLGLAEAGAFPGLWYMLTRFYTTPEVMPLVEITCSSNYRCISLWYVLPAYGLKPAFDTSPQYRHVRAFNCWPVRRGSSIGILL